MLLASQRVGVIAEPVLEFRHILNGGLVSDGDVGRVVQKREVGDLVSLAVVLDPDARKVVLGEDVVLVHGRLSPACAHGKVLRHWRRAEENGPAQHDERGNVAEPRGRGRRRPLQVVREGHGKEVVGENSGDRLVEEGHELVCAADAAQVRELLLDGALGGARVPAGDGGHEDPLGDDLVERRDGHLVLVLADQEEHVAVDYRITRGHDARLQVSCSRVEIQEGVPIVEVERPVQTATEVCQLLLAHARGHLTCLEVLAAQQLVGVLEPRPSQPNAHGHPDDVGGVDLDDLVEGGPVVRHPALRAELVDLVMGVVVVDGQEGLDEVLFGEMGAAGVDAHEYLRDVLLVSSAADLEGGQQVGPQVEQVV